MIQNRCWTGVRAICDLTGWQAGRISARAIRQQVDPYTFSLAVEHSFMNIHICQGLEVSDTSVWTAHFPRVQLLELIAAVLKSAFDSTRSAAVLFRSIPEEALHSNPRRIPVLVYFWQNLPKVVSRNTGEVRTGNENPVHQNTLYSLLIVKLDTQGNNFTKQAT